MFKLKLFNGKKCNILNANRFLSQLGATFNQKPSRSAFNLNKSNALNKYIPFSSTNSSKNVGLFGHKELKSYDGFYKLKDQAEFNVNTLISEACSRDNLRERKLVQIFDDISNELCKVADLAEFVRTAHPNLNYRQAANLAFSHISQIVEKLNTNHELYSKLKSSLELDNNHHFELDECDRRVCKLFLLDFEQSGIHLDASYRERFVALNDQLINLLTKFQISCQQPSEITSSDLDPKFMHIARLFRTDPIQVDSMFIQSDDELLREFVYRTYLKENKLQETYFRSILSKRKQLAHLCGYETFSHRANLNTILETPENIMQFLRECSRHIYSQADKEFSLMKEFKSKKMNSNSPLMQWDVPLISSRLKKEMFDLDRSQYMAYFSLGSCMEGLNLILSNLYNVNLEVVELGPGEAWHDDIYKLAVRDAKQGLLGYIYCDFYQRPDKFSNVDCHFTIQCSKQLHDSSYQLPIVVLHLNFPAPVAGSDRPTLLSFEMMENLFHEFGHAMHSMFAKTRYQHVSGTRCTTDFAEVPSQLMEYFCREPSILKQFAKHYGTQQPMDDRLLHKLCESKRAFSASELQTQLLNSMLDQAFHTIDLDNTGQKPTDLIEKFTSEYHSLTYVPGTHWHLRFTHLVGYGAKYYSYLVSKAIASQIWHECFANDPLNSSMGEKYRRKLLEYGGEKRPQELINSLMGFDLDIKSFVKSLTKHI